MAARARPRARRTSSIEVLASLGEGLRAVSVLLWPYMPASVEKLLLRARRAGARRSTARCSPSAAGGRPVEAIEPLFPKR